MGDLWIPRAREWPPHLRGPANRQRRIASGLWTPEPRICSGYNYGSMGNYSSFSGASISTAGPLSGFFTSFWKLADLTDSIGANTLTNNNTVTFSAGKIGNAANFVNTSLQSLSVADTPSLQAASQFTIALWLKYGGAGNVIVGKDSTTDREFTMDISGTVRFYVAGGAAGLATVALPGDGLFHNYIAWYDGSVAGHHTVNLMIDNGAVSSTDITTTVPPTGNANFRIGARDFVGSEGYITGSIDAFGWAQGKIPSAAQRTAIWNGGAGVEPPF